MSDGCQFPGCGNSASATYCPECRQRVKGPRPGGGPDWISLAFLAMLIVTLALIASAILISLVGVI